MVSGRFWWPVSLGGGEGAAAYQTKEYMPPGVACVGREVEESVQHCAKTVFYLSTWENPDLQTLRNIELDKINPAQFWFILVATHRFPKGPQIHSGGARGTGL